MPYSKKIITLIILLLLGCFTFSAHAQYNIPKKPEFIPPVIDSTKTLSKYEYDSLYEKLKSYSDSTSTEIMVVIIPTTKGENIGLLTPRWGQKWGIGQAKEDNGIFILLAIQDRNIWISPGYGVENRLTAGIVGEITRNSIIPEFKRGSYFTGLDKGVDAIFDVLTGAYKNNRKKSTSSEFPISVFIMLFIFFIIFLIVISNHKGGKNNRGNMTTVTSILDAIILSNMGRGSYSRNSSGGFGSFGGGSSSSGGGFGGFGGGGGFSGGGAGGSW